MRANEIRAALGEACTLADTYLVRSQINRQFPQHTFELSNTPVRDVIYGGVSGEVKTRFKGLTFRLSEVDEKYGFGDGGILDPVYYSWLESRGWRVNGGEDNIGYPYVRSYKLLWAIWERHLFPVSGLEDGEVFMQDTVHNPIRCKSLYYTGKKGEVWVEVDEIVKLADEIFPARSGSWLNLYNQLTPGAVRGAASDPAAIYLADIFEPVFAKVSSEVEAVFLSLLQAGPDEMAVRFTQVLEMTAGAIGDAE